VKIRSADMKQLSKVCTYYRSQSVVFLKTKEEFGGFSNMAGGFTLQVNGLHILTSEALYQACRFPHMPEVQRLIIEQASPMAAKMKGKPYRYDSRPDWEQVRVEIMRWCLRVKLAQNWEKFSKLFLATEGRVIVEESRKGDFLGAKPIDDQIFVGRNVLGQLLMELREEVRNADPITLQRVEPLAIPNFLLNGQPIKLVVAEDREKEPIKSSIVAVPSTKPGVVVIQASLFDSQSWIDPEVPESVKGKKKKK